jgi:hypothetical protein
MTGLSSILHAGKKVAFATLLLVWVSCGGGTKPSSGPQNLALQPPSGLVYSSNPATYILGSPIVPNRPVSTGGAVASYSVPTTLPLGLRLDPGTGVISGTPLGLVQSTPIAVIASNSAGWTSASIQITVYSPTFQTLNLSVQIQEHSQWCWAASSASILPFFGKSETQCSIVNYVRNIDFACGTSVFNWTDGTANRAIERLYGTAPSVSDLMAHFGKPCTGRNSPLSFSEIQAEIGAKRPLFMNWEWSWGGGHVLACIGWNTEAGNQEVMVMDPWPNEGIKLISYEWACAGGDPSKGTGTHTWRWSLTVNP